MSAVALLLLILMEPQVEQLSVLPLQVWLQRDGAVALELPILLESQVKQLRALPSHLWPQLYSGSGL